MNKLAANCRRGIEKLFTAMQADVKDVLFVNQNGEYDPETQSTVETPETLELKGLRSNFQEREVNDVTIQKHDIKVKLKGWEVKDFQILHTTNMIIGGETYDIVRVRKQLFDQLYIVQGRQS